MIITDSIKNLIKADRLAEALTATDEAIRNSPTPEAELHFLRGKILWRMGRKSEALAAYALSAELDPDGPASRAIELASEIDSFFNPDLLNP